MARITGGQAKGRVLRDPVAAGIRPTSDRVREALFSMIGQDLAGARVLDAFGGTGVLGLEAWSRGAEVTVVERDRRAIADIRSRAEQLGATPPGFTVRAGDVLRLATDLGRFEGVLVDPPWALEPSGILDVLAPIASEWLVLEADVRTRCPERTGDLALDRVRHYGRTALWVYRAGEGQGT